MKIVSSSILIIAGGCLALGLVHLRFWLAERNRWDYLAFSAVCVADAVYAVFEVLLMNTVTPESYNYLGRWAHIPAAATVLSVAWFTYVNLGGQRWLFWTIFGKRGLVLFLNFFVFFPNINFRQINSIERVTILGEQLSYPVGVPSPWMVLPHLAFLLMIFFCLDASAHTWRKGDRRKALVFGVSILLFTAAVAALAISTLWGFSGMPLMASVSVVFLVAGMFYQVNYDMHRMAMLSGKLIEREHELNETLEQLDLAASAGNVGVWTRKLGEDAFWVSDAMRGLFGFSSDDTITIKSFFQRIHPDDRQLVEEALKKAELDGGEYHIEYRIVLDDGQIRWIDSRGKGELSDRKITLRGASVDVTTRKAAEEAVHELSRKLINAQEEERARLARELHDDLNQSLALLSIRLGDLRRNSGDPTFVRNEIDHLDTEIERLSSDVHRISHELHPAKLKQLGLEAALRGFCREVESAYPIRLTFSAKDLPRALPADVSLCLYRIAQESLQNVVKHSGADSTKVEAKADNGEIFLTISDNGYGFDIDSTKTKESLGLISMHERVRAVNGSIKITSKIGAGSTIEARVPIGQEIN